MKNLSILWGILYCLLSSPLSGQTTLPINQTLPVKPSLFGQFPEKSTISELAIEKIFAAPSGAVKIQLADNLRLEGTIVEKLQKSKDLVTINVKLSNYDDALFT